MHIQLKLAHKVPDHVGGCANVRVWARAALERVRHEADSNACLHTSVFARGLAVMSENVCADEPSSTLKEFAKRRNNRWPSVLQCMHSSKDELMDSLRGRLVLCAERSGQ